MGRERDRGGSAPAGDLLHGDRVGERVESRAAVLLGKRQAEETELGHLPHDVGRELLGLVELPCAGRDDFVGETARGLAHLEVFFSKQQIHGDGTLRVASGGGRCREWRRGDARNDRSSGGFAGKSTPPGGRMRPSTRDG
jgi:hypothetical protein